MSWRAGYEAGLLIQGETKEICRGTTEQCQQYYLEPGKLYQAEVIIQGGSLKPPEALYEALRSLYKEYPGVYLVYVNTEPIENGYRVTVQIFDPGPGVYAIIAVLILIVAALITGYFLVKEVRISLVKIVEEAEKHPLTIGLPLAILVIGAGVYLLGTGVKKMEKS